MTREEALAGHRKLWNEIADMIESGVKYQDEDMYKYYALNAIGETLVLHSSCYLCHFAISCSVCPLRWDGVTCADGEYGDFHKMIRERNYTPAAILARKIANLSEMEWLNEQ